MPNITVYNRTSGPLVIPSGYYVDPIRGNSSVTFEIPDSDEFLDDTRIQYLIGINALRVERSSGDSVERPLPNYTTASLPSASDYPAGTVVWNTTERAAYVSDGTSWTSEISGTEQQLTAGGTAIAANRFVDLNTAGALVVAPNATGRWAGVSSEAITAATVGKVVSAGRVDVMAATTVAANDNLVCGAQGLAAPYQAADISLGATVAGADASDDIDQTNLPAKLVATCSGNETGNTLVIYGKVGGVLTIETLTLGASGGYTSTNTWTAIYCIRMTVAATGNIEIRDGALVGLLIPQITALDAARWYGAIVPSVATDSKGHPCQIKAGGANASEVVLYGTDYANVVQAEIVTMNGAAYVEGTYAYRSLTRVFIGADGIAWNAGATSQYDQRVQKNEKHEIRAWAIEAGATPGTAVGVTLLPQNTGLVAGNWPAPYHASLTSWAGGGATTTVTVNGVLATDIILCTMNSVTAAQRIVMATRTGADTVTVTYDGAPGASSFSLLVFRP